MMNNLQQLLKDKGNGYCALIISPENRKYFTGFESSDGFLIVTSDRAVFITDGRYIEAAEKQIDSCEVVLLGKKTYPQIAEFLKEMNCRHLLVESTRMTVSTYNSLKGVLKNISISTDSTLDAIINSIRSIKTEKEVESIVKAQRIAEDAFSHILKFIKVGMTEKEIALELDFFMLRNGGEGLSFEMERVLQQQNPNRAIKAERILEINPNHEVFKALEKAYENDKESVSKYANVLYTQALLMEGILPTNPKEFADILCELMINSVK